METLEFLEHYAWHPVEGAGVAFAFERLTEHYGIRVKSYPFHDTYVLNYDQIESPDFHPIVRECRSLVLNGNLRIVSRSFDRFFNYGQGECEVDFNHAWAMEKADGSLIGVYFNGGSNRWEIRTRGTAFGESELPSGRTYREAILECFGVDEAVFQLQMNTYTPKDLTLIFEFVSPENRIVTRYSKPEMVLLAARFDDGAYSPILNLNNLSATVSWITNHLQFANVRACRMFPINTVEQVEEAVAALENLEEGFVVVDEIHNRVKIKSPAYVKAHHIRGEGLTPKKIAELVADNEHREYLTVFPEDEDAFLPYIQANINLVWQMQVTYDHVEFIESQRDFALDVKDLPYAAIMFTVRKLKCSITHAWSLAKTSYKVELIIKEVSKG